MAALQPAWISPPEPEAEIRFKSVPKELTVYNSLKKGSKTPFIPLDPAGKRVSWYACGPTVYDDAHLGHARNYVSTDIIRRILRDHFLFNVQFVMNITDVDDKIILAARQQHFLREFISKHPSVDDEVRRHTTTALAQYLQSNLPLVSSNTSPQDLQAAIDKNYGHVVQGQSVAKNGEPPGDKEAKIKMHIKTALTGANVLADATLVADHYFSLAAGVLLPYLDTLHKTSIDSKDHSIFTALTKEYEKRFFEDMAALNVEKPDVLTRVTEYGPQIVKFVEKIQQNGFAYEHEGSVYYDTRAWEASGGVYARLEPWSKNDQDLQADGEGALSKEPGQRSFKKSTADFALWKKSRPGEPGWESPWGMGRPGWHIECSAMASDILGKQFDIHSGGIDLAFPHHDNELAQSEAYWYRPGEQRKQWVNYFIHMGHLSIQGAKMSKSLKNFTTIREALAKGDWTPRSLRIAFLRSNWYDGLEITPQVIASGIAWEDKMTNFFLKARDLQDVTSENGSPQQDDKIRQEMEKACTAVDRALLDSFDTRTAMDAMSDLVTEANSLAQLSSRKIIEVTKWLTNTINVFGLDSQPREDLLGWSGIEVPEQVADVLTDLSALRGIVRTAARSNEVGNDLAGKVSSALSSLKEQDSVDASTRPFIKVAKQFQSKIQSILSSSSDTTTLSTTLLEACDELRNDSLRYLGIYLEDREDRDDRPAMVRLLTKSERDERQDRDRLAALTLARKTEVREKFEREARERAERARIDPRDMFRTDEFSAWDNDGLPTRDKEGNELTKSRSKKLRKEWEKQSVLFNRES